MIDPERIPMEVKYKMSVITAINSKEIESINNIKLEITDRLELQKQFQGRIRQLKTVFGALDIEIERQKKLNTISPTNEDVETLIKLQDRKKSLEKDYSNINTQIDDIDAEVERLRVSRDSARNLTFGKHNIQLENKVNTLRLKVLEGKGDYHKLQIAIRELRSFLNTPEGNRAYETLARVDRGVYKNR